MDAHQLLELQILFGKSLGDSQSVPELIPALRLSLHPVFQPDLFIAVEWSEDQVRLSTHHGGSWRFSVNSYGKNDELRVFLCGETTAGDCGDSAGSTPKWLSTKDSPISVPVVISVCDLDSPVLENLRVRLSSACVATIPGERIGFLLGWTESREVQPYQLAFFEHHVQLIALHIQWLTHNSSSVGGKRPRGSARRELLAIENDVLHAQNRLLGHNLKQSQHMAEDLRRAEKTKDDFLATLGHELRGALGPILASLDLLGFPDVSEGDWAETHETMRDQMRIVIRLVDDLLDVARIVEGKFRLDPSRISLAEVVRQSVYISRPYLDRGNHTLQLEEPSEAIVLEADLIRLVQVVSNLLTNAAKYTPAGGTIRLETGREGTNAFIRVTDNGIGISEDELPQIFQLFSQVPGSLGKSQGGLGIGLSLVASLVSMHGGRIEAVSDGLGLGSQFTVYLPVLDEPNVSSAESLGPGQLLPSWRVLLVDDDTRLASLTERILRRLNQDVRCVGDGVAALETLRDWDADLILSDISMPRMGGVELADRLRRDDPHRKRLLVALTGHDRTGDTERFRQAGFDHHLAKPIGIGDLRSLLQRINLEEGKRTSRAVVPPSRIRESASRS